MHSTQNCSFSNHYTHRSNSIIYCNKRNCTSKGCGIQEYCMEYACVVWNPHTAKDCALLDVVQNQAARWIMRSHWDPVALKWTKSSSNCVSDLSWPSLATRRVFLTCLFLFHVFHGQLQVSGSISCPNLIIL